MKWHDYIKIRNYHSAPGDAVDPGVYEIFQGIGETTGSGSGSGSGAGTVDLAPVVNMLDGISYNIFTIHGILRDGLCYEDGPVWRSYLKQIAEALQTGKPQIDPTAMQAWLTAVNQWLTAEDQWIDDTVAATEAIANGVRDLPAIPDPPPLPDLTGFISLPALIAQFGPWGIVAWVGIQVVKRMLEGWIQKKMNPGASDMHKVLQEIRDALKKGLLYEDGAKSILEKALLYLDEDGKQAFLADIKALLENAEAAEGVLEIGKNAIWTKSKVAHH